MWERILEMGSNWALTSGLSILISLVLMIILVLVVRILIKRFRAFLVKKDVSPERVKRIDTIISVSRHVLTTVIVVVTVMMIIPELGLDIGPVLATVGIAGLALSFGAQSLVRDVISGFFMIIENQIRVGDGVRIGEHSGTVEAINLRTTRLRDFEGNLHVVPNGSVNVLINKTKDFSQRAIDVGVAYREDADRVMDLLRQIGEEVQQDQEFGELITAPFEIFGIEGFDDSAVTIRTRITTAPGMQYAVAREIRRRIKKRFDEHGIEIPFPHRTIYWGEPERSLQQGLMVKIQRPEN